MVLLETAGHAADAHQVGLLENPTFWVAVSLVIFLAIVWIKGRPAISQGIGAKIDAIRAEIEEAERLKEEALSLLAQYQRQHREALEQAEAIIENAKAEAKRIKAQATKRMDEQLARREAQAMDKIRQAEETAVKEVRAAAVELALAAAETVLVKEIAKNGDPQLQKAIDGLASRLH